jgi:hypothetical protein
VINLGNAIHKLCRFLSWARARPLCGCERTAVAAAQGGHQPPLTGIELPDVRFPVDLVAGRPGQSARRSNSGRPGRMGVGELVGDLALDSDAQFKYRRGKLVARFVQTARMCVLR